MNKMKKAIAAGALLAACALLLTACTTTKGWTFSVDTGDKVKVSIETSKGYNITGEVPFSILKDNEEIMIGKFGDYDDYDVSKNAIDGETGAVLLKEGKKDGFDYFFCTAETKKHTEYGYFLRLGNTTIALITTSLTQTEAEAVFDAMAFSLKYTEDREKPATSIDRSSGWSAVSESTSRGGIDLLAGSSSASQVPGGEILSSDFTIQESDLSRTFEDAEDWETYAASMKTAIESAGYTVSVEDGRLSASDGGYGFTYEPNSASGQYREARFLYWGTEKFDSDRLSKDLAWFTGACISPGQIERCLDYTLEHKGNGDSYYVLITNEDDTVMFHVEIRNGSYFVYLSRTV